MSNMRVTGQSWRRIAFNHLALARISNSPTVVTNTLVGVALAGGGDILHVVFVALSMVLCYTAGMYLNDYFDYEIDLRQRPERPLPSGAVSRRTALIVTVVLFVVASLLLLSVGLYPFIAGLFLIALIVCYDAWHKKNPLSPVLMALCRIMVYVIAFLAFSSQVTFLLLFSSFLLLMYTIGFTYLAKCENRPLAVHILIILPLFLPIVFLIVAITSWSLLIALLFAIWIGYSLTFVYMMSPRQIGRAVGQCIAGIALLDGLILSIVGSTIMLEVALLAFVLTFYLQRYVKGT